MNDRKHPDNMTHDQMIAEALTGNPEPLRAWLDSAADLGDPNQSETDTAADERGAARDGVVPDADAQRDLLRADLAAVRRTAELVAEAKRQHRERAEALGDRHWQRQLDRRDRHELKAAEYQLGDMTHDYDAWAYGLSPAQASDTYLAALLAGDRWDDGETVAQLQSEILDRYGLDLHDLPTAARTDAGPGDDEPANVHAERNTASHEDVDTAEPELCSTCDGNGWISSPAWLDWHNRSEATRRTWEAENPDPYDFWDQSNEAAALYFDHPNEPEQIECNDCDGTGQKPADAMESMSLALRAALEGDHHAAAEHYDRARQANPDTGRAVEDDILALLDRTSRDDIPQPDGLDDRSAADTAKPSRYVFVSGAPAEDCPACGGDTVIGSPAQQAWNDRVQAALATWRADHDGDEESWWATDDAAALIDAAPVDEDTACPDCHGSGLVGVQRDEDRGLVDADGEPVFAVVPGEYRQDPTGSDAADTETGPTSDIDADPDTTDTRDPKAAAREPDTEPIEHAVDEANDVRVATPDDGPVGDDTADPVAAAELAVLELKGRRALEEQHARDRERGDPSRDSAVEQAAAGDDAWGRPGPVLTAFDD